MKEKYIFIKKFKSIPEGSEMIYFRKLIYINGCLISPQYYTELLELINDPYLRSEYLKKEKIIKDKV